MNTLFGMKVIESPLLRPRPKIQVHELRLKDGTLITTPEFLARENRWWAEQFGYVQDIYMIGNMLVLAPKQMAALRNAF